MNVIENLASVLIDAGEAPNLRDEIESLRVLVAQQDRTIVELRIALARAEQKGEFYYNLHDRKKGEGQ